MCEYRNKYICKIWSAMLKALFCMAACMAACPLSAFAADSAAVTAAIPVSVTVSGTAESGTPEEGYTFRLNALNGAPMPESDTVMINGAGSTEFVIDYEKAGVYQYTVTQEIPETGSESYDNTMYYVTVTVQNIEGGEIGVTVLAHRGSSEGAKCDICFENVFEPSEEPPSEMPAEPSAEPSSETSTEPSTEPPSETSATAATEASTDLYLPSDYMLDSPEENIRTGSTTTSTTTTSTTSATTTTSTTTASTTSTESSEAAEPDAPQTGDSTPVGAWFILMMACFWLTAGGVFHRWQR